MLMFTLTALVAVPGGSGQWSFVGQIRLINLVPHVISLDEQIANIAKISIIGNLSDPAPAHPHHLPDFILRPAKAA